MADVAPLFRQVCDHATQTALWATIQATLEWDERTMLPPAGGEYRAEQATAVAGMIHRRWTDSAFVAQLGELAAILLVGDAQSVDPALADIEVSVRRMKRRVDKKLKLPQTLVEELARTTILGQQAWQEAKQRNDFASFRPLLEQIIHLKQQEAEALGYVQSPYDALLDDYEPEARTADVASVLAALRNELVPLVAAIAGSGRQPKREILRGQFPVAMQEVFGREAATAIGFDFSRGRLDVTAHPFCTTLGPNDHRITTRYDETRFASALFGILHETGHALYEQGLAVEHFGLPLGETVSLGIHESQSRLWENLVGRSRGFWEFFLPRAKAIFPGELADATLDDFLFAVNDVRPSLVRIEADEATYNLHILARFELEQSLLIGDLAVGDLPDAWRAKYREYLGIEPPTDSEGVLQDVHWSAGLIGYFPTYSLGNLYASQFFAQAEVDLGPLDGQFARGQFTPLLGWLREKVHAPGQRFTAAELCRRVTGKPLSHEPFLAHLRRRFNPLHGLA
jgi:carboxypeptidase Taq